MQKNITQSAFEYIVEMWCDIVNYAYHNEGKKKTPRQCVVDTRSCKNHVIHFLSKKYPDKSKKELTTVLNEILDYNRLIYTSGAHIRLGKEGIEKFVKLQANKGEWDYNIMMKNVQKLLAFKRSPDEYRIRAENAKKKRKEKLLKKNMQLKNKKSIKDFENGVESKIRRPPIKDENGKIISTNKKVFRPKSKNFDALSIQKSNKSIIPSSKKVVNITDKNHLQIKSQQFKNNSDTKSSLESIRKFVKDSIDMDDEYLHLLSVLLQVKNENKGKPMKEKNIFEKAILIDPDFAKKFFERVFHMTPFVELLKFRPTGYIM